MKPFCHHDGRNVVDLEFAGDSDVFPLYTADALVAARQDAFERAAQQCELGGSRRPASCNQPLNHEHEEYAR